VGGGRGGAGRKGGEKEGCGGRGKGEEREGAQKKECGGGGRNGGRRVGVGRKKIISGGRTEDEREKKRGVK